MRSILSVQGNANAIKEKVKQVTFARSECKNFMTLLLEKIFVEYIILFYKVLKKYV